MTLTELGRSIRERRETKGLDIQDVVDATGLSSMTILRIEGGLSDSSFTRITKICAALDTSLLEILQDNASEPLTEVSHV